jgi:type II secretion system protein G
MTRRQGFTLVELLLVTVIIGIMGTVSVMNFKGMQDSSNNASAANNLREVGLALERYRSDRGQLPTGLTGLDGGGLTYLVAGSPNAANSNGSQYLPGNKLPMSPWSKPTFPQTGADVTYPLISFTGNQVAAGSPIKSKVGTVVATPGTYAASTNYIQSDYGLIQYSPNTIRDIYAIIAVGKKGRQAIIVSGLSNAN